MKNSLFSFLMGISGVFAILMSSCAKDEGPFVIIDPNIEDTTSHPPDTIPEPSIFPYLISFNSDVKPIFPAGCIMACHNPNHPKLDLRPPVAYEQLLTAGAGAPYVNVDHPKHSTLYLHLVGVYELMPQGGPKLSQGKIDTVFTWIYQGALNN